MAAGGDEELIQDTEKETVDKSGQCKGRGESIDIAERFSSRARQHRDDGNKQEMAESSTATATAKNERE